MSRNLANPSVDLALIAVFAALIAVLAVVPGIPMPGTTVPITLQTLGVILAGLVLGGWRGFCAVMLYILVGLVGIPIFAQGMGGFGVFASMSIGYLLAFPIGAFIAGALARIARARGFKGTFFWFALAALIGSLLIIDVGGIIGMMIIGQVDVITAFVFNLPFVVGDIIKSFAGAGIALAVNKAFPALLAGRKTASL